MSTVEEAYEYCENMVRSHYENFPVGSFLVPKDKRKHVWSVYAFARTADDFADEGRDARESQSSLQQRLDLLDDWESRLLKAGRGEADHPIFVALAESIRTLDIPVNLLKDLLTAYRMDVRQKRYKDLKEVLFYCKHSANPVGRLVLHIFGYREEVLNGLSDQICTALQLANFWQDVSIDLAKDRIYIPQDDLHKFRVTEGDLHAKICNRAFQMLLRHLCDKTQELFNAGLPLCSQVGGDLRVEMKFTWLGGTTILKKIRKSGFDVYRKRPVITLLDKFSLLIRSLVPFDLEPDR